jgi:hypothetical protein
MPFSGPAREAPAVDRRAQFAVEAGAAELDGCCGRRAARAAAARTRSASFRCAAAAAVVAFAFLALLAAFRHVAHRRAVRQG